MTHPLRTREHLEAVLVALALVRPDSASEIELLMDPDHLSPAAASLLGVIADDPAWCWQWLPDVRESEEEGQLAARALEVTIEQITFQPLATLIDMLNELPVSSTGGELCRIA